MNHAMSQLRQRVTTQSTRFAQFVAQPNLRRSWYNVLSALTIVSLVSAGIVSARVGDASPMVEPPTMDSMMSNGRQ